MEQRKLDQATALAALLQASAAVEALAKSGELNESRGKPLIDSLFRFDAPNSAAIYGGITHLNAGLDILDHFLDGRIDASYRDTLQYSMQIIALEKHLRRKTDYLEVIHSRLSHIDRHAEHFDQSPQQIYNAIAAIYQDTVSNLPMRIKVVGSVEQLQRDDVAAKVRTLLLCGIRAAVLWRQVGGRRWHLLLGKGALRRACHQLQDH